MNGPETWLFCYLRTGGGHLAPARSVARYLEAHHAEKVRPVLVDGLTAAAPYARYIIEDGYRLLQAKAKWYYEFLYATNKFPPIGALNVALANLHVRPYLRERIREERPSKIVLFHFFLIAPVHDILAELGLDVPVVTVVTDPFTAHPLWFRRQSRSYVLFSERLRDHCLVRRRIPTERLHVFPFILDDRFSAPMPPDRLAAVNERFALDPARPTVLIIGGGDGIPHGDRILQRLLASPPAANIAIVCGKNTELYEQAMRMKERHPSLLAFGFVDFVYDLLNAADIVVTKCGASTIMEVLMLRKVPVIIDYLWEQELGNMEFVRDNGMGIYEPDIAKLPAVVRRLCEEKEFYESFVRNIERAGLRNGTRDVAEFLLSAP